MDDYDDGLKDLFGKHVQCLFYSEWLSDCSLSSSWFSTINKCYTRGWVPACKQSALSPPPCPACLPRCFIAPRCFLAWKNL
jgi:hypothetical protein